MKTAEGIAKEILYLPVTNGKSEASIKYGSDLIHAYTKQYAVQVANLIIMECAKQCDKSSHPALSIFQIDIEKFLK